MISVLYCTSLEVSFFAAWDIESENPQDIFLCEVGTFSQGMFSRHQGGDEKEMQQMRTSCQRLLSSSLTLKHCSPDFFSDTFGKSESGYLGKSKSNKSIKKKKRKALRMSDKVSMFSMSTPDVSKISGVNLEPKTGSKISSQFTVSGHFRLQPCGKGLTDKKMIWIEPYEKGLGLDLSSNPGGIKQPMTNVVIEPDM